MWVNDYNSVLFRIASLINTTTSPDVFIEYDESFSELEDILLEESLESAKAQGLEVLVGDLEYDIEVYKAKKTIVGLEIEQPQAVLREYPSLQTAFSWHKDDSCPYETGLGPTKEPTNLLKLFIEKCSQANALFQWRIHTRASGCGSHIHIGLLVSSRDRVEWLRQWQIAWNTVATIAPFLMPFWCWNHERPFRVDAMGWCNDRFIERVGQRGVITDLNDSYLLEYYNYQRMYELGTLNCKFRQYWFVTFNVSPRKPLTIELRANETHPTIAMAGLRILCYILNKHLEAGSYPCLTYESRNKLKSLIYTALHESSLERAIDESPRTRIPEGEVKKLVRIMESIGPFEFEKPFLGKWGDGKRHYDNAWEVFKDIVNKCARPGRKPTVRDRVSALVLDERGNPINNWRACWRIFDEEFEWDEGPPVR